MIDWVKKNVVPKYPNVVPVKTEEVTVPLDNEIADIVFTINLHHELENPTLTVNEAYKILKPGGKIFIVDYKRKVQQDHQCKSDVRLSKSRNNWSIQDLKT